MYYIIVNPSAKSGMGQKQWNELKAFLEKEKMTYVLHLTKSARDTVDYTRKITGQKTENEKINLVVLGGDGTLNCVVNGICNTQNVKVTYLPAGTSNDFARALGLNKKQFSILRQAKKKDDAGKICDVGTVDFDKYSGRFMVSCGVGYDAATCEEVMHTPAKGVFNKLGLGKLVYLAVALKQLYNLKPVSADLYLEDGSSMHFNHLYFAVFMQQKYEGGGFCFCPRANCEDGLLDVCVVADISKLKALSLFPLAAKGTHVGHKGVYQLRTKGATIKLDTPLFVHTDGEIAGKSDQVTIGSLEHPLHFTVPKEK